MTIALLSGIGLMYLILVMQFGSFTAPLARDAVAAAVADRRGAGAAADQAAR
jgi:multidrug efflux pump subunit AcrB